MKGLLRVGTVIGDRVRRRLDRVVGGERVGIAEAVNILIKLIFLS